MHYTRSMIARKLRRIARLLRYADALNALSDAKNFTDNAITALDSYRDYLGQVSKLTADDSTQTFRQISNFFTMADTFSNNVLDEAIKTFERLYQPIVDALKKAKNADNLETLKRTIYSQTDNINALFKSFDAVKRELVKTKNRSSRNSMEYRTISDGTIGWQNHFIYDIYKALGLK